MMYAIEGFRDADDIHECEKLEQDAVWEGNLCPFLFVTNYNVFLKAIRVDY